MRLCRGVNLSKKIQFGMQIENRPIHHIGKVKIKVLHTYGVIYNISNCQFIIIYIYIYCKFVTPSECVDTPRTRSNRDLFPSIDFNLVFCEATANHILIHYDIGLPTIITNDSVTYLHHEICVNVCMRNHSFLCVL